MRDGLQVSTFSMGGVLSKPLLAYLTYGLRRNGSVFYAMKLNGLLTHICLAPQTWQFIQKKRWARQEWPLLDCIFYSKSNITNISLIEGTIKMEDVKCTLVLYFNDMTTLKRVPTLLEQDCILSSYFCVTISLRSFSLFFLQQEQDGPSSPAAKKPKKKKELKKLGQPLPSDYK